MKTLLNSIAIALVLSMSLVSFGCSASNLIVLLDGVSAAAEAAVPLLSTSGVLSPPEPTWSGPP